MPDDFPDDSDGDALRRVRNTGSDLSKPMLIEFQVAAPSEAAAQNIANVALSLGYRARVYDSPGTDGGWTCECSTRMLATHEGVLAIQRELGEISAEFGGFPDGWGTFGNKPSTPG